MIANDSRRMMDVKRILSKSLDLHYRLKLGMVKVKKPQKKKRMREKEIGGWKIFKSKGIVGKVQLGYA